jgi:hypothetical protein
MKLQKWKRDYKVLTSGEEKGKEAMQPDILEHKEIIFLQYHYLYKLHY